MSSPTSEVVVLRWSATATADRRADEIALLLGAEVTAISLFKQDLADAASIRKVMPKCTCLITDAETLAEAVDAMPSGVNGLSDLTSLADHVFVYGFRATDRHCAILRTISSGGLVGVEPVPDADFKFHIAQGHREWCGPFSGLDVPAVDGTKNSSFVDGRANNEQAVLVRAGQRPFFVRVKYGRTDAFLVACEELANLEDTVSLKSSLLRWFSRLAPLMIFLRGALKERVWHSEHPQACFIIDDPLLRRKYGFLDYAKLLETMRQQNFSVCIAFIPWNYRRSSKKIADLFSTGPFSLSLCVHGCDHTRAEFASTDGELLRGKARLALDRMRVHKETYGAQFDDVMVFPQGFFSTQALNALDSSGYLAAINTTVCPMDSQGSVTLRDFLDVAVTRFAGAPLFVRHYPTDAAEFAFDLFLGKPAFVVEHHGYFRNGYEELQSFAKRLNELDDELEWNDPATICSRACVQRTTPHGVIDVRFYTDRFMLENNTSRTQNYRLSKRQTAGQRFGDVTVNGRPWMPEKKPDIVTFSVTLKAGERADIKTLPEDRAINGNSSWKPTTGHNVRVLIRRVLSEVRDDRVETNRFFDGLLSGAHKLRARREAKA